MSVAEQAKRIQRRYAGDEDRPLGGYVAAMGAYSALVGGLTLLGRAVGARLPERFGVGDTLLLGAATFKASRLLAKDAVTSPLRAPFTRYEEPAGDDELNESVPGTGHVEHAVGELVSCPFCLNVWVGTGLAAGLVIAPRPARLAATVLTAVGVADALHLLYDAGKKLAAG
ncbi:DUF1360 domain-containing protein [Amycolatopsis vancoresmycina]|uniref:Integral membrane protein n=1 Tax=Amycolatopsis vancoresmycina DSM 44592 TaxID=1292037 RepID=R1GDL1_9PSEU|nr:DUF1360 domain-containing protein [Amycolatopsis vancoresmycina]EOD69402.1 hypothetical protein H480_06361 [Amycolatopsis vancoresmycina DSM 44592]